MADLVLLVYDVSDLDTVDRIESDWLPRICAVKEKVQKLIIRFQLSWWETKWIRNNYNTKMTIRANT